MDSWWVKKIQSIPYEISAPQHHSVFAFKILWHSCFNIPKMFNDHLNDFFLYLQQEIPDELDNDRNHTDPVSELDDFGNLMKAMGAGISFDPFVKNESENQNDGKRKR